MTTESRDDRAHIPALDGVRGLAISLVLVHHLTVLRPDAGPGKVLVHLCHFGGMGVDLFFVLSGFLITGILYESKQAPRYFRNFYARRILRIFPLYYLFLSARLALLVLFDPAAKMLASGEEAWYWVYLQNLAMARQGEWFPPFAHTWSLAIEEQFYFVWPLLVFLVSRRALMSLCGLVLVGAPALRLALLHQGWPDLSVYVLTLCRLDTLALGSLLALHVRGERAPERLRRVAPPVTGAAAILFGLLILWRYPEPWDEGLTLGLGQSVGAVFFCGLLVSALTGAAGSFPVRFFEQRLMRALGKYSYAIYILHVEVTRGAAALAFPRRTGPEVTGAPLLGQLVLYPLGFLACLVAGWLSWNLFEKRFLALKRYFPRNRSAAGEEPAGAPRPS